MSPATKRGGFRSTWLLMLFVALLAGYTFWEFHKSKEEEGVDTEQERKLFTIRSEDVQSLHVQTKEETIDLVKTDGHWRLTKPVQDDAEDSAIEAYVYSALIQKGRFFRTPEEAKNTKWADFGLEPAGSTLEIHTPKLTESIQVSSKNAFDGSYYVRQGSDLLLGDHGLAQLVGRTASTFRSRALWRDSTVTVESADMKIDYDGLKDNFNVVHQGDKWVLDPKPTFNIDPERVANWLVHVQQIHPSEIVAESLTEDAKREDLLVKPSAEVIVHFKKEDGGKGEWHLTLGQDKAEDVYVYASSQPTVYKMQKSALDSIRVPKIYFRDGKAPFQYPVENARVIEVHNQTKSYKFKKEGGEWKLDGGEGELHADRLVSLVQQIHALDALEFVPAASAKGFKSAQEIVVRDEKGQILLDLSWGDTFKSGHPYNKSMTLRYVKTNLEKEALGVNSVSLDALVNAPLVTAKPHKAE